MTSQTPAAPNAAMEEFWNGPAGQRWTAEQHEFDRLIAGFGQRVLDAAAPRTGECCVDLGCGTGSTSLALAGAVGPTGQVLGVDLSEPMLNLARHRSAELEQLSFARTDASTHGYEPIYDLVFSRFGVMFFSDPVAAFAHVRTALKAHGRLVFLCWAARELNPWITAPAETIGRFIPAEQGDPDAPGPFSLGQPERVTQVLSEAGYRGVSIEVVTEGLHFGSTAAAALELYQRVGPPSRALAEMEDEAQKSEVLQALEATFQNHLGPQGVVLPGQALLVQARV